MGSLEALPRLEAVSRQYFHCFGLGLEGYCLVLVSVLTLIASVLVLRSSALVLVLKVTVLVSVLVLRPSALVLVLKVTVLVLVLTHIIASVLVLVLKVTVLVLVLVLPLLSCSHHCYMRTELQT